MVEETYPSRPLSSFDSSGNNKKKPVKNVQKHGKVMAKNIHSIFFTCSKLQDLHEMEEVCDAQIEMGKFYQNRKEA